MGKCKNVIRDRDMFGQPVLLNFNRKGNTHNTLIGGFVSILVKCALIIYFAIHLVKLIYYKDDKISVTTKSVDLEILGEVSVNSTNFNPVFVLMDMQTLTPLPLDEHTSKHLSISFVQTEWDWPNKIPPHPTKLVLAKKCSVADFNRTPKLTQEFMKLSKSKQSNLICPQNLDFKLLGDQASPVAKFMSVIINKC